MREYITVWEDNKSFVVGERVVRCRDCAKWLYFDDEDGVRFGDCAEFSKHKGEMHATRECGFCYWGERKEGGDDR